MMHTLKAIGLLALVAVTTAVIATSIINAGVWSLLFILVMVAIGAIGLCFVVGAVLVVEFIMEWFDQRANK